MVELLTERDGGLEEAQPGDRGIQIELISG
jgi:hypothetical protein